MNLPIGTIASKVGSWTMLSRIFGYIRDMLMAQLFGAGAIAEAFQIAFSLPNLFRNLLGEGAMNAALIPKYSQLNAGDQTTARQFLGDVFLLLGGLLIVLAGVAYLFMPEIISVIAWGFEDAEKIALTVDLARICLPYLYCIILVAIFSGVLNHAGYFSIPAAIPIVLNIALVSTLVFGVQGMDGFSVFWLAYAVVIAGFVQLGLCLYSAQKAGILPMFGYRLHSPHLKAFFWLLLPGITSALFLQINLLVNRAFASTLAEGSIVWLFFAERVFQLPLALIGISLGIALLPMLSNALSDGRNEDAKKIRNQALRASIFFAFPAACGLVLCAEMIINLLFVRGAFTTADSQMTASALQVLAIGLPAYIFIKVLQPQFFARRNTKTPMVIALAMMLMNIGLSIIFIPYFAHIGLAMATAISGWGQVILLVWKLRDRSAFRPLAQFSLIVLLGCALMGGMVLAMQYALAAYSLSTLLETVIIIPLAALVYLLASGTMTGYKWRKIFQR